VTGRRWARRVGIGAVIALQLFAVARAYWADHDVFGFQMFPESSLWRADISRVDAAGVRHDVREPWPGGYRWDDLVVGRGLDRPFHLGHADTGLASTVDFFEKALEWVARNTPEDRKTVYLEAIVTTRHNGREPETRILRSSDRPEAAP
jgi:hypothetical protein